MKKYLRIFCAKNQIASFLLEQLCVILLLEKTSSKGRAGKVDVKVGTVLLRLEETGRCSIEKDGCCWEFGQEGCLVLKSGREIPFSAAEQVSHDRWETGVGAGIRSRYSGFDGLKEFSFETILWAESATGDVYAEWIPLEEGDAGKVLSCVRWPGYLRFDEGKEDWYSLLNLQQGLMLPNTWPQALRKLPFDVQLCSCAA